MKKNRITLSEKHLMLISAIKFREIEIPSDMVGGGNYILAVESNSVYGGSDLLEDVSMAIGCYDEHIKDTEENSNGIQFEKELEDEMFDMHEFIMENLSSIELLLHYWSNKGGLTPGTYNTITLQKES